MIINKFSIILNRSLSKNIIGSLLIKVINVALVFSGGVILARALGPMEYGIYTYVNSLILLLVAPIDFGVSTLIVRETAKALSVSDHSQAKGIWIWSSKLVLSMSILMILIFIIYLITFPKSIEKYMPAILIAIVLIPIIPFGNLRAAALRGLGHVLLGQLPEFVIRPLSLLLFVFLAINISKGSITAAIGILAYIFASGLAFILGMLMLYRKTPDQVRNANPVSSSKQWTKKAIPLGLVSGMTLINQYITTILIGNYLTSTDVAIYKVASQLALLSIMPLTAINVAVSPGFAKSYANGQIEKIRNIVIKTSKISFLLSILIASLLIGFGQYFISYVYGPEYSQSYFILTILLVGQLINSSVGSVGVLLMMTNNQNSYAIGVTFSLVTNFISSVLLLPKFGLIGSAIANVGALMFLNIYSWHQVKSRLKINTLAFSQG